MQLEMNARSELGIMEGKIKGNNCRFAVMATIIGTRWRIRSIGIFGSKSTLQNKTFNSEDNFCRLGTSLADLSD